MRLIVLSVTALLVGTFSIIYGTLLAWRPDLFLNLDASVYSAAAGAFLLASCEEYPFSLDRL